MRKKMEGYLENEYFFGLLVSIWKIGLILRNWGVLEIRKKLSL